MIDLLKEIPLVPDSITEMPFRYAGNDLASDVHNWSEEDSARYELGWNY